MLAGVYRVALLPRVLASIGLTSGGLALGGLAGVEMGWRSCELVSRGLMPVELSVGLR
jgi:hypothetical protein